MKTSILSFTVSLLLLFSSCQKNAAIGTSNISFKLKAGISPVNGAKIVWTTGTAGVSMAKIEAKKNDSTYVEFKTDTSLQINLFESVVITNIAIPIGNYGSVVFRTELKAINSKPTLFLDGNYTAGGVTEPISFEVATPLTIRSFQDNIILTIANGSYTSLTTLGLITLTQDVTELDLKACSQTSGKILISTNSNVFVYNKMIANLAKPQVVEFK